MQTFNVDYLRGDDGSGVNLTEGIYLSQEKVFRKAGVNLIIFLQIYTLLLSL
jgi:hypothetical protein